MGGFSLRRDVGGGEAQEPPMGSHCSTDGGVGHIRCNAKLKILKLLKHKTSKFEDNCKDVCGGSAAEKKKDTKTKLQIQNYKYKTTNTKLQIRKYFQI